MGLYLCVFASDLADDEIDGVALGGYDDFGQFRDEVHERLETVDGWGQRFPTLLEHSDCDGDWTVDDCRALIAELVEIRTAWSSAEPLAYTGWQAEAARDAGHRPASLAEYFIDTDSEVLLDRLIGLAELAIEKGRPITFM